MHYVVIVEPNGTVGDLFTVVWYGSDNQEICRGSRTYSNYLEEDLDTLKSAIAGEIYELNKGLFRS